jgi:hypothetical protein
MSFVINTTIDKNAELLEAYKELYKERDTEMKGKNCFQKYFSTHSVYRPVFFF